MDVLVKDYTTTLSQVLGHHAPLRTKKVRARPKIPWYTSEIAEAKRRRRKAERRWRRTRSQEDLLAFKKLKNHVTYISTRAKRAFYLDFVNNNSEDQGKLFRATRSLLLPRNELCFPEYTDNSTLPNDIGRFFGRKIAKIRAELDACTLHPGTVTEDKVFTGDRKLDHFNTYSVEEMRKLVSRSSKKSCQLDPMPTNLIVGMSDTLLPVITNVVNSSLSLGHFPSDWKTALVGPRLKKTNQGTSLSNLRPVSNLQYLSKLVERTVYDQTTDHVTKSGLYPILQSAYRLGHSTETALLKIQSDILAAMDNQRVTLLVLLDLSAAFDTIDHQVLLNRLYVKYGITGTALKWFNSYLSDRKQRMLINGSYSSDFDLPQGVPQGSCLGPLLFTLYASKLFDVVESHLPNVHAYAGDTQLYISFKPEGSAAETDAVDALQTCIRDIRTWMVQDKLQLNDAKTEFLIIGTRAQLNKVTINDLQVGEIKVSAVFSVRNLGAWFDANMNMTTHINTICQSIYYHLHNIRRIRKYLSYDNRKSIVQAIIMSRLDYCNGLLYGTLAVHLGKLQRLQNAAARLVCTVSRYDHITPSLISLHWLPVTHRIEFKIAMLVHKCISGVAPQYLLVLIKIKVSSRYQLRSYRGILLMDNSYRTKKTLGDRAFENVAPKVWNKLHLEIRKCQSLNTFKVLLKTHLFKLAFY